MTFTETLEYTPQIAADTAAQYAKVERVVPKIEWPNFAPYVSAINALKKERNAIILAHNYQTPEIYHCVADFVGDSLGLARKGASVDAEIIVMAGVHFMAETTKILNPEKIVLMPDMDAGCSLAASITAADVRAMREKHPGAPVVSYVNTSADVKAETDICCTSGNAVEVVESLGVKKVIFLPDQYLASYVASQTDVEIIAWPGSCEVHERFTGDEIRDYKKAYDQLSVIAHPECPPDVLEAADFVGSTAGMIDFVGKQSSNKVLLVTECSMSDNVSVEHPDVEFIRPCNLCPHMKKITLPNILDSLRTLQPRVEIDPTIIKRAHGSVERMLAI
ncbi:MAG: quinolinate synthase NadA [Rhodospirillaceae bacterium]|nr:quinolinate synthase NadA [Rhodospirillaceae bacterium]